MGICASLTIDASVVYSGYVLLSSCTYSDYSRVQRNPSGDIRMSESFLYDNAKVEARSLYGPVTALILKH